MDATKKLRDLKAKVSAIVAENEQLKNIIECKENIKLLKYKIKESDIEIASLKEAIKMACN